MSAPGAGAFAAPSAERAALSPEEHALLAWMFPPARPPGVERRRREPGQPVTARPPHRDPPEPACQQAGSWCGEECESELPAPPAPAEGTPAPEASTLAPQPAGLVEAGAAGAAEARTAEAGAADTGAVNYDGAQAIVEIRRIVAARLRESRTAQARPCADPAALFAVSSELPRALELWAAAFGHEASDEGAESVTARLKKELARLAAPVAADAAWLRALLRDDPGAAGLEAAHARLLAELQALAVLLAREPPYASEYRQVAAALEAQRAEVSLAVPAWAVIRRSYYTARGRPPRRPRRARRPADTAEHYTLRG